jgi:hypothetical protein
MGLTIDFIVDADEDPTVIGQNIIRNMVVGRLKYKKPVVIFIGGKSGEGKSFTGLKIMEIINNYYGVETDVENQVIYTPIEYGDKIDKILFHKDFKKYRVIMIDEAREVVSAKLWYSFINKALSDINAMMRRVKPICIIVISQFIKDIDVAMRRTLNYYIKAKRPLGKRAQFKMWGLWMDDRNIENPKLRKRRIKGLIKKNGRRVSFRPKHFEVTLPKQTTIDLYEEENYQQKARIIKGKLDELMRQIEIEIGDAMKRIDTLVDYYIKRPESLHMVVKRSRGKLKVRPEIKKLYNLTKDELKTFKERLIEQLEKKDLAKTVE